MKSSPHAIEVSREPHREASPSIGAVKHLVAAGKPGSDACLHLVLCHMLPLAHQVDCQSARDEVNSDITSTQEAYISNRTCFDWLWHKSSVRPGI